MQSPLLSNVAPNIEQGYQRTLENTLRKIGPSGAVKRFLSQYGNVRTRAIYACEIRLYIRFLQEKGLLSTGIPDWLIQDNLESVFESKPTDVPSKRKHTDWLN